MIKMTMPELIFICFMCSCFGVLIGMNIAMLITIVSKKESRKRGN